MHFQSGKKKLKVTLQYKKPTDHSFFKPKESINLFGPIFFVLSFSLKPQNVSITS